MYKESSLLKRFLAYLIDNIVLFLILYLLIFVFTFLFHLETIEVPNALIEFTNGSFSTDKLLELINTDPEVAAFFDTIFPFMSTLLLAFFVIHIIYFIVIPSLFKNYQTLGRLATKTSVVDNEGYLVSFGSNSLRVLGDYLILLLNSMFAFGFALNLFFLLTRNRTLGDIIAKTKLINLNYYREITVDESKKEESEYVEVVTENNDDM